MFKKILIAVVVIIILVAGYIGVTNLIENGNIDKLIDDSVVSLIPTAYAEAVATPGQKYGFYRYVNNGDLHHYYTTSEDFKAKAAANNMTYEGQGGFVYRTPEPGTVPLYRGYAKAHNDYVFTTDKSKENRKALKKFGFVYQGIGAYLYPTATSSTVALYAYFNPTAFDHYYTIDTAFAGVAVSFGYEAQGTVGYVFPSVITPKPVTYTVGQTYPFYRFYKTSNYHHYYTTDQNFANQAKSNGYIPEGVGGYVFKTQATGTVPLYRAYSKAYDDYVYTINAGTSTFSTSSKQLFNKLGYERQGISAYVYPTMATGTVPLYRYFSGDVQDHYYSIDESFKQNSRYYSYDLEGIEGYVFPGPQTP